MLKTCTLAALLACTVLAAPAQATAPCPTRWTPDGFVALRKGPGTNHAVVKKLWFESFVDIYRSGHTSKWLRVSVNGPGGMPRWQGFVRKSLIDLDSCG